MGPTVPDLRGMFLRGHGGNSAALGVVQGDAIRNITGNTGAIMSWTDSLIDGAFSANPIWRPGGASTNVLWATNFSASRVVPTAVENRPVNVAVRYLIRASQ